MNLLELQNTVWMRSRHRAQDWAEIFGRSCVILWKGIRMITDLEYESPSWWKCGRWLVWEGLWTGRRLEKAGPFFWRDPLGRRSHWWERTVLALPREEQKEPWKQLWLHQALVVVLSPAAFRNALCQRLCFLSGFSTCPGNVCSLNSQIHFIRNLMRRRKWVLSAFSYHVSNGVARCWSKASSPCQNKQCWGCGANLALCIYLKV